MLRTAAEAVGLFAATNVDDLLLLALWFGRAADTPNAARRVVAGQYLGFGAILAVCVLAALGLRLLPERVVPWLGLVPVALGVRAGVAAWREWRGRDAPDGEAGHEAADHAATGPARSTPTVLGVAAVTAANGGDNVGVYVPVPTRRRACRTGHLRRGLPRHGRRLVPRRAPARDPPAGRPRPREVGHVLLPVVLVAVGVAILVEGGVLG